MLIKAVRPGTLAAGLILALASACSSPTDEVTPGLNAAKGGGAGEGGGSSPTVTTADPVEAPQGTTLDVTVTGTGYDPGSSVDFLLNGKPTPKVKTNSSSYVTSEKMVANITIAADAAVDLYDVRVTASGGKKGIGIELFAVLQQGPPGQWDPPQLTVTMRDNTSTGLDAVRSDDGSPYVAAAHISGNGNLMFGLGAGNPRSVLVTTTVFDGATRDRIYTNNHTNPGGDDSFGLLGMVAGSAGTAVFEVELNVSDNDPYEVLRYGKDCTGKGSGSGNVISGEKAATTLSGDGRTWTITGTIGRHCKQLGKKPGLSQVGTAGPFLMTLEQVSP